MKRIIIGTVLVVLTCTGCTAILSPILNSINSLDFFTRTTTDKGIVDHAVSNVMDKDCKISNLIKKDRDICEEKLIDRLEELDCIIYSWDKKGNVFCSSEEREYQHK